MTDRLREKLSAIELHHEILSIVREEIGLKDYFAEQIAEAIVRGMRRNLGTQTIYIPAEDRRDKYALIREEFNGRNRDEIMKKYEVSKTRLYEILKLK